ncbi:MAG TPA: lysoplasmalogenase [Pyrinomonadaceae bacterium]|nr:lysoplasmalogenase [Pyrinomonadaceae bacterium]
MLTAALSTLVLACALLNISAEQRGARRQVYVYKPLTTLLIILVALQSKFQTPGIYKTLIVAGLLFSLAGDVFLMLPRDRFVEGLGSFLAAHVFYVAAFAWGGGLAWSAWAGAALAAYGALMLGLLWPRLGKLKGAVSAYVAVILLMAWAASSRYLGGGPAGSGPAAGGALLFVASDTLLAWNRFKGGFRAAQALVLGTYFAAQWLIALST